MIAVTTTSGQCDRFNDASSWHVDEQGDLHIRKANKGNVATYARGLWVSARERADDLKVELEPVAHLDGEVIIKALRALKKRNGLKSLDL